MNRRKFLKYGALAPGLLVSCDSTQNANPQQAAPSGNIDELIEIPMSDPPKCHLRNESDGRTLQLFYQTNKWELLPHHLGDLERFVSLHPNSRKWIVEGHCDERGSFEYNQELGMKRASNVEQFIRNRFGENITLDRISYGEGRPVAKGSTDEAWARNRRTVTIPDMSTIHRGLELLPADAYLLDASGSMLLKPDGTAMQIGRLEDIANFFRDFFNFIYDTSYLPMGVEQSKWGEVMTYKFPSQSDVYAFNSHIGLKKVNDFTKVAPRYMDGTPLWDAMYVLIIRNMEGYRSITVLTDGNDTMSRTAPKGVIDAAKDKNIKVSLIGVGDLLPETKQHLIDIARNTGGGFYIK